MTERGLGALRRQADIYLAGLGGRRPVVPVDPNALELAARETMSAEAFAYTAGAAGVESTRRANRSAFERWRIVPRMLRDVSEPDTCVELFGRSLPTPVLLAPIGVLELAHRDADVAASNAAADAGIPVIFSNQASRPMEDCAHAMGDEAPRWFQLYWSTSNEQVESFVRRAERCGCEAIVVTLDTTMLGWRPRDLELGHLPFLLGKGMAQYTSDPVFRRSLPRRPVRSGGNPVALNLSTVRNLARLVRSYPGGLLGNIVRGRPLAAVQAFLSTYSRPSLTWDDIAFLRERTALPIVLKGILSPEDAQRAIEHGADGVIVSNHGGRQVDGAIASLDALPGVVEAVDARIPVLLDSGVRTGADVVKALALGATAVCIGRPYVYGLALAGQAGVRAVISDLAADFELTMRLAGSRSASELPAIGLVRAGADGALP